MFVCSLNKSRVIVFLFCFFPELLLLRLQDDVCVEASAFALRSVLGDLVLVLVEVHSSFLSLTHTN